MRAAIYARVSTKDKGQSVDGQLQALREYACQRGWEIAGEYAEEASAGDLRKRVQWRELLDRARTGGVDLVLVTKLDRAFRSVAHCYDSLEYLSRHKVGFVASTQPIDTTDAAGRLLLGILACFAEFEKDLIRERTLEGLEHARANGVTLGRPKGSKDKRKRRRLGYFQRWDK